MKKKTIAILCLMVTVVASAQFTNPGFYRVHSANTKDYISIKGTHYEESTNPDAFWPCILMQSDSAQISDPGSIIYIPRMHQTSLYAQGVSTYSLTGLLMDVDTALEREGDRDTYVATTQVILQGRLFTCFFRDRGFGLTAGSSDKTDSRWWIEPVNEASIDTSYLGLVPVSPEFADADGWYWATMCVDYPVLLPVDGGVEGAYTIKEVKLGSDGQYYAAPVKVYGQGDIVPAATPILFKCKATYASGNKVVPVGDIANNTTFPLVNDMLNGNYFSPFINHCDMKDATHVDEYIPEESTLASGDKLALGVNEEGRLGFYPQEDGTYMVANTAWLNVADIDIDANASVFLGEAPGEPEEPETPVLRGDANGDGVLTISDVTFLIDYLISTHSEPETINNSSSSINLEGADVNGDGVISITDVTALIDILLD